VALNTIILTPSMGMVKNSTNINKTNSYLSPQLIENKKDHNNCQWKSRSYLETGTTSMSGLNQLKTSIDSLSLKRTTYYHKKE
jgi:hypothetical protein